MTIAWNAQLELQIVRSMTVLYLKLHHSEFGIEDESYQRLHEVSGEV